MAEAKRKIVLSLTWKAGRPNPGTNISWPMPVLGPECVPECTHPPTPDGGRSGVNCPKKRGHSLGAYKGQQKFMSLLPSVQQNWPHASAFL